MAAAELCCPVCAAELTVEQLFAHEETREAFARLARISIPLGSRLLAYVALFAPAKNRQTIARKVKILEELLPDLQRQAVTRKGRDWAAPPAAWSLAIDQMLSLRDQGKLTLPLTSHGYLHEVIAGMADKVERADEAQREQSRRSRAHASGSAAIGSVMDDLTPDLQATQAAIARHQATHALHTAPAPVQPGTSPLVRRMKEQIARKGGATAADPLN